MQFRQVEELPPRTVSSIARETLNEFRASGIRRAELIDDKHEYKNFTSMYNAFHRVIDQDGFPISLTSIGHRIYLTNLEVVLEDGKR